MEGTNTVVSSNDIPIIINEFAVDRVQAAFEAQEQNSLIYSGRLNEQNLYHVTRMVATSPKCLLSHVRRIFLSIDCKNRLAVIGAFVDLFLVLKGRGKMLFERLLKLAVSVLGSRLMSTLERTFLSDDIKRVMRLPLGHSVLVNGRAGTIFHI